MKIVTYCHFHHIEEVRKKLKKLEDSFKNYLSNDKLRIYRPKFGLEHLLFILSKSAKRLLKLEISCITNDSTYLEIHDVSLWRGGILRLPSWLLNPVSCLHHGTDTSTKIDIDTDSRGDMIRPENVERDIDKSSIK